MLLTPAGMIISVKPEFRNALSPMLVTPAGMAMEVKADAPWNADKPMLSREEFGANVTEAKLVALWNALSPMVLTPEPISTLVNDVPGGTV